MDAPNLIADIPEVTKEGDGAWRVELADGKRVTLWLAWDATGDYFDVTMNVLGSNAP